MGSGGGGGERSSMTCAKAKSKSYMQLKMTSKRVLVFFSFCLKRTNCESPLYWSIFRIDLPSNYWVLHTIRNSSVSRVSPTISQNLFSMDVPISFSLIIGRDVYAVSQ